MWCGVVWCGVVWCGVVWCGVVWCGVVWCGVMHARRVGPNHDRTLMLCSTVSTSPAPIRRTRPPAIVGMFCRFGELTTNHHMRRLFLGT